MYFYILCYNVLNITCFVSSYTSYCPNIKKSNIALYFYLDLIIESIISTIYNNIFGMTYNN